MKTFLQLAMIAAIVAPVAAFAGTAPYENAVNKALHPGCGTSARYAPRRYAQPRVYSQPSTAVAAAPAASSERRVFSYEPGAATMNYDRGAYSYEPAYGAPYRGYSPARHSYENATMKGLGQIR
jgi:hypothetical protein